MKIQTATTCRKCGKDIQVIAFGIYHKAVVDAKAVMIIPDPDGREYVRIDGSKVRGRERSYESDEPAEAAYRQHRFTCGGGTR